MKGWTAIRMLGLAGLMILVGVLFPFRGTLSARSPAPGSKVPSDLDLLKAFKTGWQGISCTGRLAVTVGGGGEAILTAPMAISYAQEGLRWVTFVTPPTPCAGTVLLGRVKIGLGNKSTLKVGTPPGMVIGDQPARLAWRDIDQNKSGSDAVTAQNLCAGQGGGGEGETNILGGFAGGMGARPDTRAWDPEQSGWLRLDGTMKGETRAQKGRYSLWLDPERQYMPALSKRVPEQGPPVTTRFRSEEVTPGHWLPTRWEISSAGKATVVGQIQNLRCDQPLPDTWFDPKTYPDLASQKGPIQKITGPE